uniref:Uncharacterized protein n=1 Tax=Tanacetum cinerariifolium TaxID=118510 RepID=A0A6L2JLP7_TANCI|nr:hypothetical protein [Tanacetum cinerariifolium]
MKLVAACEVKRYVLGYDDALYNKSCGCSKGDFVDKFVRDPNKTPDSSQRPPHNCLKCGNPMDGLYGRQCALLRKKLKEVWFTICEENEVFQDFRNTSESSNDNTNVVNAPQEPFVFNHDPGENSSQSPPHIDHHCCYGCGDSLDNRPAFYNYDDDDDEDYTIAITPVLSTEEPVDSLIVEDEHLDTIPVMESDEVIKSSVEDLVPIPNQFEDFYDSNDDSTSIDDDYFSIDDIDYVEASPLDSELINLEEVKDFHPKDGEIEDDILHEKLLNIHLLIAKIESLNDKPTSDHVLKSPSLFPIPIEPDQGELTSVVMEDILGEPRVHVPNILPTHPTLYLNSNFTPSNNSLPESESFCFDIEEKNSGSTTIHADIYLPNFNHFHFKSELDPRDLTSIIDLRIHENGSSTTNVNLPFEDDQSPLFAYVVWIFLLFLTYPIAPLYLLSSGNEDTFFDPGIFIYHSFMPGVSRRIGTFMKFNVYPNHLNESLIEILSSTCSLMDQ